MLPRLAPACAQPVCALRQPGLLAWVKDFFGQFSPICKQACSHLTPRDAGIALIGCRRQNRSPCRAKVLLLRLSFAFHDSMDNRRDQMAMPLPPVAARRQPP